MDTSFFPDFSTSGFFNGLCGFAEAGEGRVPVFWETLAAAEEKFVACVVDDGDDDGGVCAGETEVGDAFSGCAGWAVDTGGGGVGGGEGGGGKCRGVCGWTGALEAAVYRQGGVTALSAEGVAHVPVEELAGFGVDCCVAGYEVHGAALLEGEAFVFAGLDQVIALLGQRIFGSDVDGEVGGTLVDGILCFVAEGVVLDGLVQTEEDHLRDEGLGVECLDHLGFRYGIEILANDGLDIFVLDVGEVGLVLCQWLQVVASKELCGWMSESPGQESTVATEEAKAVQGRAFIAFVSFLFVFSGTDVVTRKVVGNFLAKLPRQH